MTGSTPGTVVGCQVMAVVARLAALRHGLVAHPVESPRLNLERYALPA